MEKGKNIYMESIFEQKLSREVEQKYLPLKPDLLLPLRKDARPIEQFYLSHTSEPFSLRFRATLNESGEVEYTATIKDRGSVGPEGLDRLEVETPVSRTLYEYYLSPENPIIHKLRASFGAIVIDFFDDGHVQAESENAQSWHEFTAKYGAQFVSMSGDRFVDNEWRAHFIYKREHDGQEAQVPQGEIDLNNVVNEIVSSYSSSPLLVSICGRSGSGKSTIVREIQEKLRDNNLSSDVISTDDYHRGATWLRHYNNGEDWTDWDHPLVYDLATMADDIERIKSGEVIQRRRIDFAVVEPTYDGEIACPDVLILEGIYAGASMIAERVALNYNLQTPMATCIGRRLLRDLRERPQFAQPEKSLLYMLEQAEPMWREQLAS